MRKNTPQHQESLFDTRPVFIYGLLDPHTMERRYVGRAYNPKERLKTHLRCRGDNPHLDNWLKLLKANGEEPILAILEEADGITWPERERYWIKSSREQGHRLTNISSGGEMTPGWSPGPFSEEHKAKIAEGLRGKPLAEERKQKIGDANRGRKHTEEAKQRISESCRSSPVVQQNIHKALDALREKGRSEEHRRKIGEASRGRKHTPESRAKISAARLGKKFAPLTEECKRKISEAKTGKKRAPFSEEWLKHLSEGHKRSYERKCQQTKLEIGELKSKPSE